MKKKDIIKFKNELLDIKLLDLRDNLKDLQELNNVLGEILRMTSKYRYKDLEECRKAGENK